MRLLELNLLAFGPFTDVTLDLSQGDHGLHIVYGPNEAGKSSALRAIHAALFGFPHLRSDDFRHDHKHLRVGAVVRGSAGDELAFVRRKGRKETLLNADSSLGPYPDNELDRFLGGVDGDAFTRVFGIGHAELRRGGEELRLLRGLSGESLFAAGLGSITGGASLGETLKQLDADAAQLYSKRRKSAIGDAKREYEQARKEKQGADLSSSGWEKLRSDLEQARCEQDEVRERLIELRTQASRLGRLRNSLRWIGDRNRLTEELSELGQVFVLPDSYSANERSRCQFELQQLRQRIVGLKEELEGEDGLHARLSRIDVPDGLFENEELIATLQKRLGAHLKAEEDAKTLLSRRNLLQSQVEELLLDLGLEGEEDIARFRIPSDRRAAIQNLANDEKRLRGAPDELMAERRKLERTLASLETEFQRLGEPRDTTGLESQCGQARKYGDLEEDLLERRDTLARLDFDAVRDLKTLGLWQGALTDLAALRIPLAETIDRFEIDSLECSDKLADLERQQAELQAELSAVRQEIGKLEKTEHVPTVEELSQRRERRDLGWKLVRRVWLEQLDADHAEIVDFTVGRPLADTYEQCVSDADSTADRLRREADRVAHLAECHSRQGQLDERLSVIGEQIERQRARQAELQVAWTSQWHPAGIDPLTPREMRRWLERHGTLKNAAREIDERRRQLRQVADRHDQCRQRFMQCLIALGEPPSSRADESLGSLLNRSDRIIEREAIVRSRGVQLRLDLARIHGELEQLLERQRLSMETLAVWQSDWRIAMQLIGCSADAPAVQANERLRRLEDLFGYIRDRDKDARRINDIERDAREFAELVRGVRARLTPDLGEQPVEQAVAELVSRLNKARGDKIQLDTLTLQAEKRELDLKTATGLESELTQRLVQLCHLAGVVDFEELPDLERASDGFANLRERLDEVESQLLELGGGLAIEKLVADAEGRDVDVLTAEIAELEATIVTLDGQREEKAARVHALEIACAATDGSEVAAEADQRGLGILSRMQADVDRFLRLRLAAAILRQQIEKYRAENQDPLLTRASGLFARLTCGEFIGLRPEYNANDQPVIAGGRHNDEIVQVEGMSEGTLDQLYLALRLGYLERRLLQREPLPLIVDDILLNFDDDRAAATLEVLADLSRQTQVIFFTHHRHLVDLAEANLTRDLFVHQLDNRLRSAPQTALTAGRHPR